MYHRAGRQNRAVEMLFVRAGQHVRVEQRHVEVAVCGREQAVAGDDIDSHVADRVYMPLADAGLTRRCGATAKHARSVAENGRGDRMTGTVRRTSSEVIARQAAFLSAEDVDTRQDGGDGVGARRVGT